MEDDHQLILQGQIRIWHAILGFNEPMVLRCIIELGIADIIHSKGEPLSVTTIAQLLSTPPPNVSILRRIMRYLARKGFATKSTDTSSGEILYGLTCASKLLIKSSKPTLVPLVLAQTSQRQDSPSIYLSECVRSGKSPHELARGTDFWSFLTSNPGLSDLFNAGMAGLAEMTLDAAMDAYRGMFEGLDSLVDVGGGTGAALGEIVKRFPNIQGINFDLPHVVAAAPEYPGVTHVGGNMLEDAIPPADAVFMKWILPCFQDEDCARILRNCHKALTKKTGKLIIMDAVLSDEEGPLEEVKVALDIMNLIGGGVERTEEEWKKVLELGGFARYNIIKIPAIPSIIEAYPN